ncbi:MAG TPA: PEPxxWA-CTERM sorting domain-containing protein [Sphingomonas sp.]|jgi:hypothetical protein|nr:PEPxxWA-CTERM sorting domain-containing protein [Sphingomonas sp.]
MRKVVTFGILALAGVSAPSMAAKWNIAGHMDSSIVFSPHSAGLTLTPLGSITTSSSVTGTPGYSGTVSHATSTSADTYNLSFMFDVTAVGIGGSPTQFAQEGSVGASLFAPLQTVVRATNTSASDLKISYYVRTLADITTNTIPTPYSAPYVNFGGYNAAITVAPAGYHAVSDALLNGPLAGSIYDTVPGALVMSHGRYAPYLVTLGAGKSVDFSLTASFDVGGTVDRGVPEPASWALLIGGFCCAGAGARLRRGRRSPARWRASS